ncbi:tyrosine--tRNA ligase [Cytophagaceae bacterium DM2B3-1]|uniref:Tyrosine--tRNA ligase n=2 Tax=Xanthocytophaga TaxID=3078918 RepID=A0ABT7CJ79_9BACT|nr:MULTISPECIES: tyrosine--tRNA ligase [Xanthocytophaga]MDJ1493787.1 tyrosine--tRNA ligase [Xanthocytophaga flavus]MDJ1501334.1 tyrosine--tRNA ligase [Xanthocytophaga agilis]
MNKDAKINFIEELQWRGMLHDKMPGTDEQLAKEMTGGYIGFDPTAASLHIGNLATIMLLVHFQRAGHKPYALVGGATGMIGDPSGKSKERNLLDEDTLQANQAGIRKQLEKFLKFTGDNAAEMVNNYDWFKEIGFLEFLRTVGKHLTVNYMMSKDSVKNRLGEGKEGISFTEFSYQLLQGYDFYWLYKHKGVRLQMGGSDQWGNITTGTELIGRIDNGKAYALTAPLVTKADGQKFGKSEGGNVWLDPAKTSPYKFYQFWLKVKDEEVKRLIRVFTLLDKETIESLEAEQDQDPGKRVLQKALAKEVTCMVHSEAEYLKAVEASEILFGKNTTDILAKIDEQTLLEAFEGVTQAHLSKEELANAPNILELISVVTEKQKSANEKTLFQSKGDARKLIQGNGVSINKVKVSDPAQAVDFPLIQNKYLLIQKGKDYCLVTID